MPKRKSNISRSEFNRGYSKILMYLNEHTGINFSSDYKTSDGFELGKWLQEIRRLWRLKKLSLEHIARLEAIGISMSPEMQDWEEMYFYAYSYYRNHGSIDFDIDYRTEDGVLLGAWIDRQKRFLPEATQEQRQKLRRIGIKA